MTVSEFIVDYYTNLEKTCKDNPYISFGLICAGIEFLGKCLDERHEFDKFKPQLPAEQFNKAIDELMPKYSGYKLYKHLRCGMLHSLLPNKKIWLVERYNANHPHLSKNDIHGTKKTVIILEDFYADFKTACTIVIEKITKKELTHPKINRTFIETTE